MFLTEKIISHRGIFDNEKIYENSLEAIKKAVKKDYIIEIDIHLTKDKELIVFHDYNTRRITGKNKVVEDTAYKELNNQKVLHIPTLKEVLTAVACKVPLLIEIKQQGKVGELETKLMELLKEYKGEYAIQSFNPKVLLWFKKNYPEVLRGQLSYNYKPVKMNSIAKYFLKNMFFNIITKPNFISYKYNQLSKRKINKYKKKGIILLAWTINSEDKYKKYKKDYDNLICEKFIN